MLSIQTNVNSLVAQQNLNVNTAFQSNTISQLTSGYRINRAGDDAAGLAVANKYASSVAELTQGVSNGNDGVSQLQIMDGGMSNISSILNRLKTLATQSASGAFTGSRTTLNQEFQTDLQEIDRQAQSIGLDTGGTFAKNLQVYVGAGSGSASVANATVGVDLSAATVDTQSLGLKGFQAVGGTADISSTSATSVSNIVNNATNKASESTPGTSIFYVTGSGFSDTGKIALSVNLNGVTDTATLATAINASIQQAASGSTTSAASFKAANITASVNTNADGTQQIAFTSGTKAFQVQAGDQMSNAIMGNFSTGSTGASLTTSVTGQVASGNATTLAVGQHINIEISGGGLAAAETLQLNQGTNAATVGAAITSLKTWANTTDTNLVNAGFNVSQNSAGQLVVTNSKNQAFTVQASGDTSNVLGLGSFALNANANTTTADYTSITAANTYDFSGATGTGAQKSPQATLQFSIGGGQAISLGPIALDAGAPAGGDATQGTNSSTVVAPTVVTGVNDALNFTVDGNAVAVVLAQNTAAQSAVVTGSSNVGGAGASGNNFTLTVAGHGTATIALGSNDSTITDYVTDLTTQIAASSLNGDVTVGHNGNKLTFTSTGTGITSGITLGTGPGTDALADMGFTNGQFAAGVAAGTTTAAQMATQIQTQMNTQLANTGASATATVVAGSLVITNGSYGADHNISTIAGNGAGALTQTLSNTSTGNGFNRTGANLAIAINTEIAANATLAGAGITASWAGNNATGHLTVASTNSTPVSFQMNDGGAPAKATSLGTVDLTSGADFSQTPATLSVTTVTAGVSHTTAVALTQNYANATALANDINGQLTANGGGASVVSVNGKQYVQITNTTAGAANTVQVNSSGTGNAALGLTDNTVKAGSNQVDLGFLGGASQVSDAGELAVAKGNYALNVVNAGGTTQTGALSFTALTSGTQALTVAGNNSNGVTQSLTITLAATGAGTNALQNDGSGAGIDQAVAYINSQLQKTNNPTLQSVVAVKQLVGSNEEINFISPLKSFQVGIGSTSTTPTTGLNAGVAETATASLTGQSSNISIDTQAGAEAAITAIGNAVSALGSAQASVGIGENQLGYAVSLASSQVTNLSAAQSNIRDANVALQAANLSKAQVLQQASIAAMAQANSAPQAVLALLRG
jgi:flagellin